MALHRFVEGALLTTVYAADAAVGLGAAVVIAAHTAAETEVVTGLWSTGKWGWVVVGVLIAAGVAPAYGPTRSTPVR